MKRVGLLVGLAMLAAPVGAVAATPLWNAPMGTWTGIQASPHDFTSSNPIVSYRNLANDRCQACHAPHSPLSASSGPLWNHAMSTGTFITYGTTLANTPVDATPNTPTLRCLGCHDGATPIDRFGGKTGAVAMKLNSAAIIGFNLGNDHPVGMEYGVPTTGYTAASGSAVGGLPLYDDGGTDKVECSTCHNPHGVSTAGYKFLRVTGTICTTCHIK